MMGDTAFNRLSKFLNNQYNKQPKYASIDCAHAGSYELTHFLLCH